MRIERRSMGKWFVIVWIVIVIATLVAMQAFLFGTRGLPRFFHRGGGGAGLVAPALVLDAPAVQPQMVQPESLPQGFIVLVTDKTHKASASSPIYMPSSHNGWNPADPKMKLEAQSDQKWRIVWEKPTLDSRVAFKFARGSWEAVETDANFKDIENRMLPLVDASKLKPGEKPVIELEIANWHDAMPGESAQSADDRSRAIHVSTGTLKRVEVVGGGGPGASKLVRDLLVWLPPGYDADENRKRTYPVLYMMDGQNLFDRHAGIAAEWQCDETAAKLIEGGKIQPLIIVGIPNAGVLRSQEYLPFEMVDKVRPHGAEFIEFVLNEVKPRIDRAFRTASGPENTGIGGSSLGAVIALEAATEHPEVFGEVIAESMPLVMHERAAFKQFGAKQTWPQKVAFGMGGKESSKDDGVSRQQVATASAFAELAKGKGLGADRFKLTIDEGAAHNEEAWAKRFGGDLEFLFPVK